MRTTWFAVLLFALALGAPAAHAEDLPKAVVCSFASGTSGSYENGAFQSKVPGPIGFEIDDINLEAQSATINAGGSGKNGKLAIARAIGASHFLEIANEGFWNVTTIYDKDLTTGLHPAVHSRHLGVVGQPQFAQYTGTCKAK